MIIDNSYFQGDIKIPNSQDSLTPLTDRRGNFVDVEEYIAKFEKQIMIYALGLTEYKDFIDQFETNGDLKAGATQKWIDFTNGKEYQVDGIDKEWEGLRFVQGSQKYSLIAYYIFSKFASDFSTKMGDAGVQKSNSKASRGYSSIPTVVESHNEFLKLYQGEIEDAGVRIWTGKNISGIDYYNQSQLNEVTSMYEYLQDNADTYDGVITRLFAKENSFGL